MFQGNPMPENLKKLRIFAASPSDVASERAKLETVVESLKPTADYLGLTLEVVDWRAIVPDAGRPQQVIFGQLKPTSWDIFVGMLWHRFGTPPGGNDPQTQKDYLSGTEEEFRTAYRLWKEFKKPRIVMYRCSRPIPQEADFTQAQRVKDFFKEIQDPSSEFRVLTQSFDTTESFEKLLLDNLQKLLIEYGEHSKTPITPEVAQVLTPTIPNNLPRRQAFFGRAKEMETVMRTLSPADRTWGVLVDGIGGIGKSAIAIEAAYRSQESGMFDAFVFVSAKTNILEPSGIKELNPPAYTLDGFLNETAHVLGQPGIAKLTGHEKRRALVDVLRSMRTLLIYDNLETLSKEEQEGIADFLRELPQGCKAIITSRRRGGEAGVWLRVEKLDWEAAFGIIKNQMSLDVELSNKLNRVGESRWQELFDETNGSPLALVHTLGLMRVRTALTFDAAIAMLQGDRDEDLQEFIFQEARKELTENDKVALSALSFFVPSATFEAWMQLANLSRNALKTTIDRLSALSLVDVLTSEERYSLHPLTRAFVRHELLANLKEARKIGMQFAQHWVDYSEQYGRQSYKTFDRLESEWGNIAAAVDWLKDTAHVKGKSVANKDAARMLLNLIGVQSLFLLFRGHWNEQINLNKMAYFVARAIGDQTDAGWRAYYVAETESGLSHFDEATSWAKKCAKAWKGSGGTQEKPTLTWLRGKIAKDKGDYVKAKRNYKKTLIVWRQLGNDKEISNVLNRLGYIALQGKEYEEAEDFFKQALELVEKIDYKDGQAVCHGCLGDVARERERWKAALKSYKKELALAREVGRIEVIANAQCDLARVHEAEGRVGLALPLGQEALKVFEQLRHKRLTEARELVERLLKAEESKK
jgi:tetratricopeptide (TPR) repeat protein